MGNTDSTARDREMVQLAKRARALAEAKEEEGRYATAAQFHAVANFFEDCVATRVRRFRTKATNRKN